MTKQTTARSRTLPAHNPKTRPKHAPHQRRTHALRRALKSHLRRLESGDLENLFVFTADLSRPLKTTDLTRTIQTQATPLSVKLEGFGSEHSWSDLLQQRLRTNGHSRAELHLTDAICLNRTKIHTASFVAGYVESLGPGGMFRNHFVSIVEFPTSVAKSSPRFHMRFTKIDA